MGLSGFELILTIHQVVLIQYWIVLDRQMRRTDALQQQSQLKFRSLVATFHVFNALICDVLTPNIHRVRKKRPP